MKAPFFDAMRTPLQSPNQFMQLLQEQQLDTVETSVKALSCRDPMALVKLHQNYMQRMVERWSKLAAAKAGTSPATNPAPTKPAPAKAASQPAAAAKPAPKAEAVVKPDAVMKPVVAPVEQAAPTAQDDLTVIKGIGPKFAQTLKDHGITSYKQLAALTPGEIEALEEKLGFSGRFAREGWIEQARALAH